MADKLITLFPRRLKEIDAAVVTAVAKTAEYIKGESIEKVPFRSGNLSGEAMFVNDVDSKKGSVEVINNTPYARRLYYHPEYNFSKDEHPEAGANWFGDFVDGSRKSEPEKVFGKFLKQEGNI